MHVRKHCYYHRVKKYQLTQATGPWGLATQVPIISLLDPLALRRDAQNDQLFVHPQGISAARNVSGVWCAQKMQIKLGPKHSPYKHPYKHYKTHTHTQNATLTSSYHFHLANHVMQPPYLLSFCMRSTAPGKATAPLCSTPNLWSFELFVFHVCLGSSCA